MANPSDVPTALSGYGVLKKDDNGTSTGWAYLNITAAAPTTTVVKAARGMLHAITFNKPVATCVVTMYDNTAASGTIIGTITIPASPQPVTLIYDCAFSTGLTITTATAASDITVAYI